MVFALKDQKSSADPVALKKADYELLAKFRYTLRRYLRFSEQAARSQGLTPQQYQALLAIAGFPGRDHIAVGELAEHLQLTHHSAVGLANRIESLGYIQRSPAEDDRRRVLISLTESGRKLLDCVYRMHRRELQSAGPLLANLIQQAARQLPEDVQQL